VCFVDADGPLAEVADAEVYVEYDQQAEISCTVRANPEPEVTWTHNDTPVNVFDNMNVYASKLQFISSTNRSFSSYISLFHQIMIAVA